MPLLIENPPPLMSDADEEVMRAARDTVEPPKTDVSRQRAGVSNGQLWSFIAEDSLVFPEARRTVRVYVPAAYDGKAPANLIVFQDGAQYLSAGFGADVALDNLIEAGDIPATIGVFVEPGQLIGVEGPSYGHRGIEYDTVSDAYSRLLLSEILPLINQRFNISDDPARRAICGMSSGGICAFTVAWHRPDSFGGVISHCGSYTGLRGGNIYPHLIRTESNRPIRVFLQSGRRDMDRTVGSWAVANHDMAAALKLKSYDYRFEFGNGGHTLYHGAAIFPQTLRWIWRS